MIIGIGTDIVKISRIRNMVSEYGDRFINRCFTPTEISRAQAKPDPAHAFARLYAAKEALLKALGTGMREGLSWHDWQISWDKYGAPHVTPGEGAKAYLPLETTNIRLSMSDDGAYAVAFAVIEKIPSAAMNLSTTSSSNTPAKDIQPVPANSLYDTIKTIFFAGLIALTVRSLAYEPFSIPSGSMVPTLLVGDYLFVSKSAYGYSKYSFPLGIFPIQGRLAEHDPKRGDIIVFRKPHQESIDYIKRLIGLPGDTIQVKNGRLYINHEQIKRTYIGDYKIQLEPYDHEITYKKYREELPGGKVHDIIEESDEGPLDNTEPYIVPPGRYFMMGDNRDGSQDSRVMNEVGFVPFENFVGRAEHIFFSVGDGAQAWEIWKWPSAIRASRFWQKLN